MIKCENCNEYVSYGSYGYINSKGYCMKYSIFDPKLKRHKLEEHYLHCNYDCNYIPEFITEEEMTI